MPKRYYKYDEHGNLYLKAVNSPIVVRINRNIILEAYKHYFFDVRIFGLSKEEYFDNLNENALKAIAYYLLDNKLEKYNVDKIFSRFNVSNINELKQELIKTAAAISLNNIDFHLMLISLTVLNIIKANGDEADY